jgi:hypothetical protein
MKRILFTLALASTLALSALPAVSAFASEPVSPPAAAASETPQMSAAPAAGVPSAEVAQPSQEISEKDFLVQVVEAIKKMGGLDTWGKIVLAIGLLIGSMKVTTIRERFWSKLGKQKVWVAPVLGFVAAILDVAGTGTFSWASLAIYMTAGAGAIALHELLDAVKAWPGIGKLYVTIIELIQAALPKKLQAKKV